ncbi:hypothetical protein CU098_009673 [Rhizopus stolonifer]|uniref:Reverse transcriptase domain-containing protein n=1 Tax=Rhizopus stolonifer TaxID=4846 RepID=A0A367JDS2_RHIST|nr:hypothetical protein CU098_009673 [Rhizopus stolonifer]
MVEYTSYKKKLLKLRSSNLAFVGKEMAKQIYQKHSGIGLLLDQEKAYDRVLAEYLIKVLHAFHFPAPLADSIHELFLRQCSPHQCLRQGDPFSPLLFTLALELLLLSILQDPSYQGYISVNASSSQQIKCLAYADDIYAFVQD